MFMIENHMSSKREVKKERAHWHCDQCNYCSNTLSYEYLQGLWNHKQKIEEHCNQHMVLLVHYSLDFSCASTIKRYT